MCGGGTALLKTWQARAERDNRPGLYEPCLARATIEACADELDTMGPTEDEICSYARTAPYGAGTKSRTDEYFAPQVDDTWGRKRGGRVHIDAGASGDDLTA
jgi:hypothetical protein